MGRFEYSCINIYCIYSNFFLQTKNLCRCFKQIFHSLNTSSNMFHMSIKYWKGVGQVLRLTTLSLKLVQGRIQDFKLGEAHLKTLRWTEGGAKMFGVFRMKNHDFTPKNHIFSNFRVRPPPGSAPAYHTNASSCSLLARHRYFNKNCCGLNQLYGSKYKRRHQCECGITFIKYAQI